MGTFLSGHPLDPYWLEVTYGASCTALEKNEIETPTQSITFAGMIVSVEDKTTQTGFKMTNIKIEDYSGTTEITLFDKDRAKYEHMCRVGEGVLVTGAFRERTNRNTGATQLRFNIDRIQSLDDLKGHLIKEMTIVAEPEQVVPLSGMLGEKVEAIKKASGRNSSPQPNTVPVNIDIYSAEHGRKLHFTSAIRLPVTRSLIEEIEGMGLTVNISNN